MRSSRLAASGLLIALLLSACTPSSTTRSPAASAAEQQAAQLATQGKFDQAAQAYLSLAQNDPANADHYQLLAVEAYRQENAFATLEPLLPGIRRDHLSDDEPVLLDLLRAQVALRQHNYASALQLTSVNVNDVSARLQPRLLDLHAQALAGTGDIWSAAGTRWRLDRLLQGADKAQNHDQGVTLLSQIGAPALRARAAAMQPDDPLLPWVGEALNKLGSSLPSSNPSQAVGTLMPGNGASVREGYSMPTQIALLLPGGDNLASVAASIREGFFAAYYQSAATHAPRAAVRVYDSGGSAASAVAAYNQAVKDGAQLVVGPLIRPEVNAVLGQANLPVPVLALNRADNKNPPNGTVSQFALLPEQEGTQAADHFIDRGLHTAYVVISTDDFAKRAAGAFKAEFTSKGGQIAGNAQLPGNGFNYGDAINSLNAGTPASDAGVFISMRAEQARLLLPQLRVARIALPVIGTSHIYGGTDDATADRDLEGVEFCDAPWLFDAQAGLPNHDELANTLPAAHGVAGQLFAFGMDAWNLVPYLSWMRSHPGSYLPGASGQLTADATGNINRSLTWMSFQNGEAHPASATLQPENAPDGNTPPASGSSAPAPSSSISPPAPGNG